MRPATLTFVFLIGANAARGQGSGCRDVPPLAVNAQQVASAIGVLPLIERQRCVPPDSAAELVLRQQITASVLTAVLDVEGVLAEIDNERSQISEVKDRLSGKRDRKVNLLTVASLLTGSGTGMVGTAMQFSQSLAKTGDWIQGVGGAGSVLFSILALRQQGGTDTLGIAPNMLAPLFGRTVELRSVYPEDVWTYLNTAPTSDPRVRTSWRDALVAEWVQLGRIGPPDAPASRPKIDKVASRIADQKRLSISELTDRSAMLMDLRSRVSLMNRDLRDLLKAMIIR